MKTQILKLALHVNVTYCCCSNVLSMLKLKFDTVLVNLKNINGIFLTSWQV